MLHKNSLDLLCIAETKLDASFPDATFPVDNYRQYGKDYTDTSGGLIAYGRSEIPSQRR